jgi:large subunit ribosomal protein L10e
MRGAFGKSYGKAARVKIGSILYSVRIKEADIKKALEAFRRAKNKFPGSQRIVVSNKWGFTKLTRLDYLKRAAEGTIINNGSDVKIVRTKGPLAQSPLFTEAKVAKKK